MTDEGAGHPLPGWSERDGVLRFCVKGGDVIYWSEVRRADLPDVNRHLGAIEDATRRYAQGGLGPAFPKMPLDSVPS